MAEVDLRGARILVTNDDGINAPGLQVLERIARGLSDDVWVVAPELEQSGASHSLTMHRPLRLRQVAERRHSVDGTPTDCVLLALNHLLADKRPALVLSGVNHGQNLGEDVTYSGTIAAAMEATLLGVRAIAMSQRIEPGEPPFWETAERFGPEVVRKALALDWPRHVLVNVNFPHRPPEQVTGIQVVRHGNRKIGDELDERTDPRGRRYFWVGAVRSEAEVPEDTDIHVVTHGGVAVTPLYLDLTHYACLEALKGAFA
ncbi:5'/3'-nucleotidase SurE [Rhodospirillum centenum]|uniref:5'-nucleotidase SurE n=1 Tax=Rhodospirillum centenum (strain ATCC 51521 / SW) TaxID=414684 RepID=B6ISM2_RHOCS|nr:5'/3'-nucleotidase SurE [Rhodospirillum centenum]ACI98458.1 5'/3'-nucleotidase SurE [Rhodospirillum centenum SW]